MDLYLGVLHLYIKTGYQSIIGHTQALDPFQWLWKSRCQGKHKVFFWLLNDRLNTRNLLRRKHFSIPSVNCVLCSHGMEETIKHLIFECEFAQMCWTSLHIIWDLALSPTEMVEYQKSQFYHNYYTEVVMLASWSIWIH
jgi:hypothetical protein